MDETVTMLVALIVGFFCAPLGAFIWIGRCTCEVCLALILWPFWPCGFIYLCIIIFAGHTKTRGVDGVEGDDDDEAWAVSFSRDEEEGGE
mmetsp:Transcript_75528/g.179417  ORF Transcript_75528/g.179417 Transcript_75528/m.179417 type:complete len:90 (+) Transcript_75528:89-358(+)|eukprot:CAMPEP_0178442962 /NCGR_PEP_ID=MMETSP0689_2-20121128/38527_1 /TAXON_ID=160604 /ORGANISM="Amphidinium massartii, Strain CS-259" /LENGTH=89 /DNA_ID=CAMNT_0020066709 /DNA_START=12 /DNA_END=281 /DNA_ORIENTATION=+